MLHFAMQLIRSFGMALAITGKTPFICAAPRLTGNC